MCGVAGFLDASPSRSEETLCDLARRMADTLRHRGPDDAGVWADAAAGIALGHRRLSIVDLSPAGHQPMVSGDGRFVIVYNGEVYNSPELRRDLEARGQRFRGHSDTEVILEGWAAWGRDRTVERLVGMFALAVWDRQERVLTLVRDRLGIKPMYWTRSGGLFAFGSELKALCAHPDLSPEIDRDALASFFRHNYVPSPHSIYRGVQKLPAAHHLTLRPGREPELGCYWDLREVARSGLDLRGALSDDEAAERLESVLRDAVRMRMIADVPLGAFLSGGIDSSTVVALMQAESNRPVRTFSIGFHEAGYDEAAHAKAVAQHLGTDHTELYVEPRHALEIVPQLPRWFDEPFSDSSQIPTYLVSEMTRRHVTVALSGDGGDELFAGYRRYSRASSLWSRIGRLPRPLRSRLAVLARALAREDGGLTRLPRRVQPAKFAHRLDRLADLLAAENADGLYRALISRWNAPERLVLDAREHRGAFFEAEALGFIGEFVERMQALDTLTYLPDDILTKVDRASMAVSLEARVPILDHRVVELAWALPFHFKVRDGTSKWLLRRVLHRHVPASLVDRPKAGFTVPVGAWLRGPLRDWAESLLGEGQLRAEGFLDPARVRRMWSEHVAGDADWSVALWDVLMFEAWLGESRVGPGANRGRGAAAVGPGAS